MIVRGILAITDGLPGIIEAERLATDAPVKGAQGFDADIFSVDESTEVTVRVFAISGDLVRTIDGAGRVHLTAKRTDIGGGPTVLGVKERLIILPLETVPDHIPVIVQSQGQRCLDPAGVGKLIILYRS